MRYKCTNKTRKIQESEIVDILLCEVHMCNVGSPLHFNKGRFTHNTHFVTKDLNSWWPSFPTRVSREVTDHSGSASVYSHV